MENDHPKSSDDAYDQPDMRRAPEVISGDDPGRECGGGDEQRFASATVDERGCTHSGMRSIRSEG
jgi:hypothetical protein